MGYVKQRRFVHPDRSKPSDYLPYLSEPVTRLQLATTTCRHINTVSRLLPKLRRWGLVEMAGYVRRGGRPSATWTLTERGREIVGER